MEAELRAVHEMRAELAQVRMDIQNLGAARQELMGQVQGLTQDLARSADDLQKVSALKAEIQEIKHETQHLRYILLNLRTTFFLYRRSKDFRHAYKLVINDAMMYKRSNDAQLSCHSRKKFIINVLSALPCLPYIFPISIMSKHCHCSLTFHLVNLVKTPVTPNWNGVQKGI